MECILSVGGTGSPARRTPPKGIPYMAASACGGLSHATHNRDTKHVRPQLPQVAIQPPKLNCPDRVKRKPPSLSPRRPPSMEVRHGYHLYLTYTKLLPDASPKRVILQGFFRGSKGRTSKGRTGLRDAQVLQDGRRFCTRGILQTPPVVAPPFGHASASGL